MFKLGLRISSRRWLCICSIILGLKIKKKIVYRENTSVGNFAPHRMLDSYCLVKLSFPYHPGYLPEDTFSGRYVYSSIHVHRIRSSHFQPMHLSTPPFERKDPPPSGSVRYMFCTALRGLSTGWTIGESLLPLVRSDVLNGESSASVVCCGACHPLRILSERFIKSLK
jgi:hypothetical protein